MSTDDDGKLAELLAQAKQRLTGAAEEFQRSLSALADPDHRRTLATEYIEGLQRGLTRAQESLDRLHERTKQETVDLREESAAGTDTPDRAPEPDPGSPE